MFLWNGFQNVGSLIGQMIPRDRAYSIHQLTQSTDNKVRMRTTIKGISCSVQETKRVVC